MHQSKSLKRILSDCPILAFIVGTIWVIARLMIQMPDSGIMLPGDLPLNTYTFNGGQGLTCTKCCFHFIFSFFEMCMKSPLIVSSPQRQAQRRKNQVRTGLLWRLRHPMPLDGQWILHMAIGLLPIFLSVMGAKPLPLTPPLPCIASGGMPWHECACIFCRIGKPESTGAFTRCVNVWGVVMEWGAALLDR